MRGPKAGWVYDGAGMTSIASALFNLWGWNFGVVNFKDGAGLGDIFAVFVVILILTALVNIYRSHLVALFNNVRSPKTLTRPLDILGVLLALFPGT